MDLDDLTKAAFSIIKDDDPYKEYKQLQIKNWGRGYLEIINTGNLPFFLDILSDEECWEKTDMIYGVKLNRRAVAKKMIEPKSWNGISNPLDDFDCYQVACWCCLEEDVISLFKHFKQEDKIKDGDSDSLKKLVKSVSGSWCTDAMMELWSHLVGECISDLDLKGQHPYVFGLHRAAIDSNRRRVEAVEFFWNKIKSLPESELSAREKDEVFMKIAVHTARDSGYPDVFEFCLSQINPGKYPELLKRDLEKNGYYGSLNIMNDMLSFDKFQELFDCLKPSDVKEDDYRLWVNFMTRDCPECYLDKGVNVFMHMWTKRGFDDHCVLILEKEMMNDSFFQGRFLVPLIEKDYMEPVWEILDKANPNQIKEFMDSKKDHIRSILLAKGDSNSLNRFLAYGKSVDKGLDQQIRPDPSGELTEVEVRKTHGQSR
ncbi:hypothetical protein E0495_03300 [Wolbachia pipientis]|uniref:Uncharacterized protein n=1 Tax=Wolbachia pipientis TaxID=955 RepID=A0A6I6CJX0_WOLPI|nr:hypothetical protein [Wolbachia pipientis]QGT16279.1 hypothetical protein E0495_03300 [Wolbachia pipientis]